MGMLEPYMVLYTCFKCKNKKEWPADKYAPTVSFTCPCLDGVRYKTHVYWSDDEKTKYIDDVPYEQITEYIMKTWKLSKEKAERYTSSYAKLREYVLTGLFGENEDKNEK